MEIGSLPQWNEFSKSPAQVLINALVTSNRASSRMVGKPEATRDVNRVGLVLT
jgi:hypothetical protein